MSKRRSNKNIITVNGQYMLRQSITAGTVVSNASLSPALIPRLTELADAFQLYRFTSVDLTLYPSVGGTTTNGPSLWCVGYLSGAATTSTPTTFVQVSEFERVQYASWVPTGVLAAQAITMPTNLHLDRSLLMGEAVAPWFKTTVDGSLETWQELQGGLWFATAATITTNPLVCDVVIKYVCELCAELPTAVSRLRRRQRSTTDSTDVRCAHQKNCETPDSDCDIEALSTSSCDKCVVKCRGRSPLT